MAALCRSYDSHGEALEAVNAVIGAGIPGEDVLVLMGEPARDANMKSRSASSPARPSPTHL